jgi:hypothetical protein
MLETPGISEYRKVKISDRCGQSAGNLRKQKVLRDYMWDLFQIDNLK